MRKILLFSLISFLYFNLSAQSPPTFDWENSFGGTGADEVRMLDIDVEKNTVVTGWFSQTVDFSTNSIPDTRTSLGGKDLYVKKIDLEGDLL